MTPSIRMTFFAVLFFLFLLSGTGRMAAQDKVITLSNVHSGSHTYTARDTILLKPGFTYSATGTNAFVAKIDKRMELESDYRLSDTDIPPLNKSLLVGSIPGSIQVSPTGSAVYQVPIEVPAGIGGIQPMIGLAYNSQSGNGIAGWGFALSGLSAITRVPKTIYSDGYAAGIKNTTDDVYALDGNRLVLVSGTHGQNQAVYHTETESFSEIRLIASSGTIPRFEALSKDGSRYFYGSASGMLRYTSGGGASGQLWCLDRYEAPNGQMITYEYETGQNLLSPSIRKISYGENGCHTIEFFYDKRQDTIPLFYHETRGSTDKLLRSIVVKTSGTLYRSYSFHYGKDHYSRLEEIRVCDEEGPLFNPTRFVWDKLPLTPEIYIQGTTAGKDNVYEREVIAGSDSYLSADLNGDGLSDLIRIYSSTLQINSMCASIKYASIDASGHTGFPVVHTFFLPRGVQTQSEDIYIKPGGLLVGDLYGQGKQSLVFPYYQNNGTDRILSFSLLSESGVNNNIAVLLDHSSEIPAVAVTDMDNDGKSNILYMEKGALADGKYALTVFELQAAATVSESASFFLSVSAKPKRLYTSDFNLDGMQDVMVLTDNGYSIFWNQGGGSANCLSDHSVTTGTSIKKTYRLVELGDFNGDGLPDFVVNSSGKSWSVYLNNGKGEFTSSSFPGLRNTIDAEYAKETYTLMAGDFEGNGKSDIAIIFSEQRNDLNGPYYNSHRLFGLLSTGSDFSNILSLHTGSNTKTAIIARFCTTGNFRGKGMTDIIFYGNSLGEEDLSFSDAEEKKWRYYHTGSTDSDGKITEIVDGLDNRIRLEYRSLGGRSVGNSQSVYPLMRTGMSLNVVSKIKKQSSFSEETEYDYSGATFHLQGKGFLGFEQTQTYNRTQNQMVINRTEYHNGFFYPSVITQTVRKIDSPEQISVSTNRYSHTAYGGKRIFPYLSLQTVDDKLTTLQAETVTTMDDYGNPQTVTVTRGPWVETQTMTYTQKGSWCLNQPLSLTVRKTLNGDTYTRVSIYEYDGKGNLTKETLDPGQVNQVVTEYKNLTAYGMPQTIETKANGITRSVTRTYTSGGLLSSETDILGETTRYDWDAVRGTLLASHDRIGTTAYRYNRLGGVAETYFPDGTIERNSTHWSAQNTYGHHYYSLSEASGASPAYVHYNAAGQEVARDVYDWKERRIRVVQSYRSDGKLLSVSEPTFNATALTLAHTYNYDSYGRPIEDRTPGGTVTSTYNGLITRVESPQGVSETVRNAAGLEESVRTQGKTVAYTYYASGNLKSAQPEGGTALTLEYDLQGNRTKLTDPDAGVITSAYDGWGQLLRESQKVHTSGDSIITVYAYFPSGLLDYQLRNGAITDYIYDALNRVQQVSLFDVKTNQTTAQSYTYDQWDRVVQVKDSVEAGKIFITATEYDVLGRVKQETFPSGYYIVNQYDSYSNLKSITDAHGNPIWQPVETNEKGQYLKTQRGNRELNYSYDHRGFPTRIQSAGVIDMNYQFTEQGNLDWRRDGITNQREQFGYDTHNRLTNWDVYRNEVLQSAKSQNYKTNQTLIDSKTGYGSAFAYGENNNKPHALTSFLPAAGTGFSGNQTITYTDFKKMRSITEGTTSLSVTYGVDERRIKSVLTKPSGTLTRYYLGSYEEEVRNGRTRRLHYIAGGDGLAAIYVQGADGQDADGQDSLYYAYTDYQGSLIALTTHDGTVKERYAYDPWGVRRNPENWAENDTRTTFVVNRGYTLHEHLTEFHLINMNGRMYDPGAGMFLSPDPYIQAPGEWLNYNRYTYALNNPLIYTDPSGELFWVLPYISYSKDSGWSFGISAGIGIPGGASVSLTAAYTPKINDFSVSAGVSFMGLGASVGYSTTAGWNAGISYSYGIPVGPVNLSTFSMGVSYSQSGGFSGNIGWLNYNQYGGPSINPSISASSVLYYRDVVEQGLSEKTHWDGSMYQSSEEMRSTISNLEAIEEELRTQLYVAGKDEAKSEGYSLRNGFMYNKKGERVGGITIVGGRWWKRSSRILMSPGVKGLSDNGHSLSSTFIHHEIIHAYHYNLRHHGKITFEDFKLYTEAVAYAYNISYYKTYGLTSELAHARKYTGPLSGRPAIMSWRHLINLTKFY